MGPGLLCEKRGESWIGKNSSPSYTYGWVMSVGSEESGTYDDTEDTNGNHELQTVLRKNYLGYSSKILIEGLRWIRFQKPSLYFCREKSGVRVITVMVREAFSTSFRKH
jgi:hypothetical protein